MAISDFHGHIENASMLATYVNDARAANPDTFFVSNGDSVGGSAFVSAIDEDNPTMDILNAMGLQLSSTGNHEFDKGADDLTGRISGRVNFPYLVTNVKPLGSIAPYKILTTTEGTTIAFVGAVTDQLPTLVSPDGIAGLTITNPVSAVDAQANLLKDGNAENGEADIVVALIHETTSVSKGVGNNVDAVISGHTHHTVIDNTNSDAPVVEPGSFGQFVGHVALTYDGDKVTSSQADVDCIADLSDPKNPEIPACDEPAKDPDIKAMYEAAQSKADMLGKDEVGTIVGGADRARNARTVDGNGKVTEPALGQNRGTEMTGGNLIAQAFYEYSKTMAKPADFGIMNPGGVRAEIDPNNDGIVTKGDSFSAQPFGNSYGTVDITGAQVYTMLEQQWADESTQTSRPMLALGLSDTISFTYDVDAAFGSHIKKVYINNTLVDPNSENLYTVASNAFLLAGGDGFNVFKAGVNYNDTGIIDNDVFNEFLAVNPDYVVDYSQRNIAISGEDDLALGETATIDLKSLSMTYAGSLQPLPETVDVSLVKSSDASIQGRAMPEPVASGTAPIDNTITSDLNETGQATVELEVPADLEEGTYVLIIEAGPTVFQIPGNTPRKDVEPTEEPATSAPTESSTDEPTDGPSDGTSEPTDGMTDPGKDLPNTGANVAGYIVVALLLLTAGGVLVARRRADQI